MISLLKYSRGDVVTQDTFMGKSREVVVTERLADVKNGEPGFDGHIVGAPHMQVWGYDRQITHISRR